MEATELRIGNYVNWFGNMVKVLALDSTDNIILTDKCERGVCDFEPISLNEEWLLKFGFEKRDDVNFDINNKGFCIGIKNLKFSHHYFKAEIKHVHQLQNLYYALTQTELTIKQMKEHEKEAERIIEMFGDKAILHVEGIKREYENYNEYNQQHKSRFDFWQQVKEAIQNK